MRVGFITHYDRVADMDFAAQEGFFGLELMCWNSDGLLEQAETVRQNMAERGLETITMGFWGNCLDPKNREAWVRRETGLIDLATKWGVRKVAGFAGRDPSTDLDGNLKVFGEFWRPLAKRAEDAGIQICWENCPMFRPGSLESINIATAPVVWERMFNEVDSPAVGLQFDPSHLYWLQVDYLSALRKFAPKVGLVHAKDTEILPYELARKGILGSGWWRYRLPGLGSIDWHTFLGQLREVGYKGDIAIEHEDPLYEGEKAHEGLLLARHNLEGALGR
jgi:sugar phosphate isomerase/epimerase